MIKTSITNPSAEVISKHDFANVLLNNASNQKSLHAAISFAPGEVICKFKADTRQSGATYLTVQTGTDQHITLHPSFLQYLNHSCAPNCWIDGRTLRALRRIEADEQLTFDYNTTEWSMDAPFECACGACSGAAIRGYAHLTSAERAQREPHVAAHLRARAVHGNA